MEKLSKIINDWIFFKLDNNEFSEIDGFLKFIIVNYSKDEKYIHEDVIVSILVLTKPFEEKLVFYTTLKRLFELILLKKYDSDKVMKILIGL